MLARCASTGACRPHSLIQQAVKRGTCSRGAALSGMRPLTGGPLLGCSSDSRGSVVPVVDETHSIVLHLKSASLVPRTGIEVARSPGGQQRRLHARRVRAVLAHMPDCRPGPGVRFLGSPESLPVPTPKGTPVGAWAFQEGGCELLLRLPRCAAAATWDRRQYDEGHLRELFLYFELNVSFTALPEELEPGRVLPDSTGDMQRVLDEVTAAFALVPVLSLMQWSHGGPGGGRGRPSPPFPDNTAAATAKLDMPLYIGDITKANGILQLSSEVQLPQSTAQRGRSRSNTRGTPSTTSPTRATQRSTWLTQTRSRSLSPAPDATGSPTGAARGGTAMALPVDLSGAAAGSGRGGGQRRKRPTLVVSIPKAAVALQAAPLLPALLPLLPATFLIRPRQALAAAAFRCTVARSLVGGRSMYEPVWDPAIVFARRMLEDPEFAPLLAPALTAKLPQGPPTSAALATAMHAVALEIGPATMMAHVATRHIGNHPDHARRRHEYIRQILTDTPAASPWRGGRAPPTTHVRGVLLKTRRVEPMHAPLLIKDLAMNFRAAAAPFSFPAA